MRERSSFLSPDRSVTNSLSFGTIHTYSGTEPRDAFISQGGTFTAILRDPICRLHSLFTHHHQHDVLKTPHLPASPMDYSALVENGEVVENPGAALNEIRPDTFGITEAWFHQLGLEILESDLDIATNCQAAEILRHEDLVGSIEGLTEGFSRILDTKIGSDFPGIAEHFDRPVNVHAVTRLSAGEIFSRWPEKFKKIFFFDALFVGFDALEKGYAEYGYEFPVEALVWLGHHVSGISQA